MCFLSFFTNTPSQITDENLFYNNYSISSKHSDWIKIQQDDDIQCFMKFKSALIEGYSYIPESTCALHPREALSVARHINGVSTNRHGIH